MKVDSLDQLNAVAAGAQGMSLKVLLRVRSQSSRWFQSPAEGLISRFGMNVDELREACTMLHGHPTLHLGGFAIHVGSQVAGTQPYIRAVRTLVQLARDASQAGLGPTMIDVGGGFPSTTLRSPSVAGAMRRLLRRAQTPPLGAYGAAIGSALRTERLPPGITTLVVEPGRVLVGPAAVLVTRVVAVKGQWVFVDASRNFVPESFLFAHRIFLPSRLGAPPVRQNLAGCTLSGGDVLALRAWLPRCTVGDVLVMLDAGAYTLSKASRFTTLMPAAYLIADDGRIELIRHRELPDETS